MSQRYPRKMPVSRGWACDAYRRLISCSTGKNYLCRFVCHAVERLQVAETQGLISGHKGSEANMSATVAAVSDLERQFEYFLAHQDEFVRVHNGKFILLH